MPVRGTVHGRALTGQTVEVEHGVANGWPNQLAPVTNRGEAIGVLELNLPTRPDELSLPNVALAAHTLAYVVIANRRFTDLFEWGQRSVPPVACRRDPASAAAGGPYTCEAGQFTLAAWLEPPGEIAGDTFDFSLDRDFLHLTMTDAMGHGLEAAVLATVLVSGLRNARRAGLDVADRPAPRAPGSMPAMSSATSSSPGRLRGST